MGSEMCIRDRGIVGMIPDVLQKVKGMFSKKKDADDFSEITQDDIDMV